MLNIEYIDLTKSDRTGIVISDGSIEKSHHRFDCFPFRIIKVTLEPSSDYTSNLIKSTKNRLKGISFNPSNSAGVKREQDQIEINSFAGYIAEQICFDILSKYNRYQKSIQISLDDSKSSKDQIDITVSKTWQDKSGNIISKKETIEVRSSFPINPIEKVISSNFDVIGPYTNQVKRKENEKDYYLRVFFQVNPNNDVLSKKNLNKTTSKLLKSFFDDDMNLINKLNVYFVGGATKEMMQDESISYIGSMKSNSYNKNNAAQYRKIKLRNAMDSISILHRILSVITDEKFKSK